MRLGTLSSLQFVRLPVFPSVRASQRRRHWGVCVCARWRWVRSKRVNGSRRVYSMRQWSACVIAIQFHFFVCVCAFALQMYFILLLLRSNNYFNFDCVPFFIWHGACNCQQRTKWVRVNVSHIYCLICVCMCVRVVSAVVPQYVSY